MARQENTAEKLSNMLVDKHQKFVEVYKNEFDILDRLLVLKEKQDQLGYWLHDSKDNSEKNQKYLKVMENVGKEFTRLNGELEALYASSDVNVSDINIGKRHKWLGDKVGLHMEATNYWNQKVQELSKETEIKEKEEDKKAEKAKVPKKEKKDKKVKDSKKTPKKTKKSKKSTKKD